MTDKELCSKAVEACKKAYSPYSNYQVGAALLCENGKVYTGSNIENASFGATVCAERVALYSAIHAGEREFIKIAVASFKDGEMQFFTPCGICRQTLVEFCKPSFSVLCVKNDNEYEEYSMEELLLHSFRLEK